MIVGLPGTGIGGMFYILTAVAMPFRALSRAMHGQSPPRWSVVRQQLALAVVVVAVMWLTGEVVGRLIVLAQPGVDLDIVHAVTPKAISHRSYNVIRVVFLAWTAAAIVFLHLLIHTARLGMRIARYFQRRRSDGASILK